MSGKGPWSYQDCSTAPYWVHASVPGPNVIEGAILDPGRGICVITQDTTVPHTSKPLKTDGDHYVLLVVVSRTSTTLTLEVTVWQ
jgi:hypothetical protein